MTTNYTPWHQAKKFEAHQPVFEAVTEIESRQSLTFDRFVKLEVLYDPNSPLATQPDPVAVVDENVIAGNVDTVTAVVAATDVRARFQTTDADWSTQRQAKHLEWYSEGLVAAFDVMPKCQTGFKQAAKKGIGINHIDVDRFTNQPRVESVMPDDIVCDDRQCAGGKAPLEIHRVHRNVDRAILAARYPQHATAIMAATESTLRARRAVDRPDWGIAAIESWRLPVGTKGQKGFVKGRYTYTIDTATLVDEEFEDEEFPLSVMVWSEREESIYGISLAERIAGHQRTLNRRNWQIQRMLDQNAAITTFVRPADANMAVATTGPLGTVAVVKGEYPKTVAPPAVHGDILASRNDLKSSAYEESGVSRMTANSMKPAGLDSGVALREYRDQTTQRFAMQEKAYERFVLDTIWRLIGVCKKLGAKAPVITRRTKFGTRKIKWAQVDMRDVKVQIAAASTLSRTPAGRLQTVLEWAQAGVISMDEARRLMGHPDLERSLSLYTAAMEGVEHALEEIQDGRIVMPEPFDNHAMCVWRGQSQYLICRENAAPEDVLEGLRQYVVQAAWMLAMSQQQPANANMPADPMAAAAGAPPAPMDPAAPMPIGAPTSAPGVAAFAPQAMQLQAS